MSRNNAMTVEDGGIYYDGLLVGEYMDGRFMPNLDLMNMPTSIQRDVQAFADKNMPIDEAVLARLVRLVKAKNDEGHLDDLVYDLAQRSNLSELNSVEGDDEQEQIIGDAEQVASNVNNRGIEGQLRYMLESGCTEQEIISAAKL